MAQAAYTLSQQASAERLLAQSLTWTRGRRKSDGLSFIIFPSSDNRTAYYANERACTCRGFQHRGRCSHELAVKREAEQAREQATRPRYEDLFPENDWAF